ncbi:MAG: IS3 family transposase [Oscillospiraceae bacterium]|nr:IS3 family transposase [Oscillospiraceae bacterium]
MRCCPKSKPDSDGECKNILSQKFNQSAPNKVWVCDFTYIKAAGRFYYLCIILDLFLRKVIAYKLSNKIDTKLAIDTVNSAVAARGKSFGIIFHTDRGSPFTSSQFRRHLDNLNMIQSFSAKWHPYDNAVMECSFKYFKKEEVNRKSYASFADLKLSLFEYINGFYNSVRPHSHNNGLTPNQAEINFISVLLRIFLSTLLTLIQ